MRHQGEAAAVDGRFSVVDRAAEETTDYVS